MTLDDERRRAKSNIDRIRHGGEDVPPPEEPESPVAPLDDYGSEPEGADSDALERVLERSERMRRSLGMEGAEAAAAPRLKKQRPQRSPMQAVLMVGGLIVVGVVAIIVVAVGARYIAQGGGLPFGPTATPTETPTPTATPLPTETPTPTPTPTPNVPHLDLPVLTCIFQTSPSCATYCADATHAGECDSARSLVEEQGADADYWLNCISPPGSDRNIGDPQQCLDEAWLAANP
jgi:hypothetical protein